MRRPLAGKRPFGPFVAADDSNTAQVAIYLEMGNVAQKTVGEIEEAIEGVPLVEGPVGGPTGTKGNVITIQTRGNSITRSAIDELEDQIQLETGIEVNDVEVIW